MARKPQVKKRYYTRLMDLYRYGPIPIGILNPIIRSIFASKVRRDMNAVERSAMSEADLEAWYRDHRVFFGFCLHRSGSTFLAKLLNESLVDAIVQHEPNVVDYFHYHRTLRDEATADAYVRDYRRKELVLRMNAHSCRVYGEMNPFLRRHCRAVGDHIPGATTFHLVRDGRNVLRSLMSRELLGVNDPMGKLTFPPDDDPYSSEWPSMSRFERLCWMWQADNRFMRQHTRFTVQFEGLVTSFSYFDDRLLKPLGLVMDEVSWSEGTAQITNATPRHRFPRYQEWTEEHKNAFHRICGEEMEACGYDV